MSDLSDLEDLGTEVRSRPSPQTQKQIKRNAKFFQKGAKRGRKRLRRSPGRRKPLAVTLPKIEVSR